MRTANNAAETLRHSESGLVWEEQISGAQGSLEVEPWSTVRVRATGATTVTIDGILAMTMSSGEIEKFCVGKGDPDDGKATVTVVIGGANAFVQVARNYPRRSVN